MSMLATDRLGVTIAGHAVCHDLSLDLQAGQCWGMLGGNGTGKTTLLHTLAGLRPPAAGRILLRGQPIAAMKRRDIARVMGLLPQDNLDPFPATVMETAMIGRHPHLSVWQQEQAGDVAIVQSALHAVELERLAQRRIDTLSGGERRRLALATLFAQQPDIWLLDEPTNHLDLRYQIRVLELITGLAHDQGKVVLMSLHDINLAVRFCDSLLLLFPDGGVEYGQALSVLTVANLQRLYRHPVAVVSGPDGPLFIPA